MVKIFKNIKELVQIRPEEVGLVKGEEMKELPTISDAFLLLEDGKITDFGTMKNYPSIRPEEEIDASGKIVLPAWCDSHSHIVFAGNRESEFVDRIEGLTYEEIAARGGGILNSAKKLRDITEEELYHQSKSRLEKVLSQGTGALEIKSGYGLTTDAELKMLRVIKKLSENYDLEIKATFLGAHALPEEYKKDKNGFVDHLIHDTLPIVASEGLAEYIDVFCETGYFSVSDTELILEAGQKYGLIPKIHVNQFNAIGGVQAGVKFKALSVDHLEVMREEDIETLKLGSTMPVALPGCSFFLGIPYTPVRELLNAGLPIALASDYNPGSAPSGNMNLVLSLACIKMKMTPEEAINAATINGAYAMGLQHEVGSITRGKKANLIMTKPINSYGFLPYSFGDNHIDSVYIQGNKVN